MKNYIWFVVTIVIAILFGVRYDPAAPFTKKDLLRSIIKARDEPSVLSLNKEHKDTKKKKALGYNANVDVIVRAKTLLDALSISPPSGTAASASSATDEKTSEKSSANNDKEIHPIIVSILPAKVIDVIGPYLPKKEIPKLPGKDNEQILNEDQFAETFLHFMHGAKAAERSIGSAELFDKITKALEGINEKNTSLGGNAALMAKVFASDFNMDVTLGGQAGPIVRSLLPNSVKVISLEPKSKKDTKEIGGETITFGLDEVHLIMEYSAGEKWGTANPERANRFIVSRDLSNNAVVSLEALNSYVKSQGDFDLLVVSGLHLLDGMSELFQSKRINDVASSLSNIPAKTRIHYELASIGKQSLLKLLAENLFHRVDSIGLNEQELFSLYNALGGKWKESQAAKDANDETYSKDVLTSSVPPSDAVQMMIEYVMNWVNTSSSKLGQPNKLTRVHFHCYGYHLIAQSLKSNGVKWQSGKQAVASGSVTATEKACNMSSNKLHGRQLELKMIEFKKYSKNPTKESITLSDKTPIAEWKNSDETLEYFGVPVIVCSKPESTVGLGDAISASALAYQL